MPTLISAPIRESASLLEHLGHLLDAHAANPTRRWRPVPRNILPDRVPEEGEHAHATRALRAERKDLRIPADLDLLGRDIAIADFGLVPADQRIANHDHLLTPLLRIRVRHLQ